MRGSRSASFFLFSMSSFISSRISLVLTTFEVLPVRRPVYSLPAKAVAFRFERAGPDIVRMRVKSQGGPRGEQTLERHKTRGAVSAISFPACLCSLLSLPTLAAPSPRRISSNASRPVRLFPLQGYHSCLLPPKP